jgi:hypothetical protein
MRMPDIRRKAEQLGLNADGVDKKALIHAIQKAEGFEACYGKSDASSCQYTDCCFRADCVKAR